MSKKHFRKIEPIKEREEIKEAEKEIAKHIDAVEEIKNSPLPKQFISDSVSYVVKG